MNSLDVACKTDLWEMCFMLLKLHSGSLQSHAWHRGFRGFTEWLQVYGGSILECHYLHPISHHITLPFTVTESSFHSIKISHRKKERKKERKK